MVVSGFVVDLGVYSAPNQPRSPFPPRSFPGRMQHVPLMHHGALLTQGGSAEAGEPSPKPQELRRPRSPPAPASPGPRPASPNPASRPAIPLLCDPGHILLKRSV